MNFRDSHSFECNWDDCSNIHTTLTSSSAPKMNADDNFSIPDVQNTLDTRHIAIQRVGVKGVRHPLQIQTKNGIQSSVGTWNMYVHLPEQKKGTHMSRFMALLEEFTSSDSKPLNIDIFGKLIGNMLELLDAESGRIELSFPFFITKAAPVSGVKSLMDYEVGLIGEMKNGQIEISQEREVGAVGAVHDEPGAMGVRGAGADIMVEKGDAGKEKVLEMTIEELDLSVRSFNCLKRAGINTVEDLISKIEAQASCELFGLLKRPDEKYVTERAYDNPKFVEDLVRDVAGMLNADSRVLAYSLEAENFESIHNHSAYACIEFDKRKQ